MTPIGYKKASPNTRRIIVTPLASSSHPSAQESTAKNNDLHIVLWGIGDLRLDDHLGMKNALTTNSPSRILPLCILSDDTLSNCPGAIAHTHDTAKLITAALDDLDRNLQSVLGTSLQVVAGKSLANTLETVSQQITNSKIVVHVCNLGHVDNKMGYGALSALSNVDNTRFDIRQWSNCLRDEPWNQLNELPDLFPEYEASFVRQNPPTLPISLSSIDLTTEHAFVTLPSSTIPSSESLSSRMSQLLSLDSTRIGAERSSGIFGSHWGGINADTIGSSFVLDILKAYTEECDEQDARWAQHSACTLQSCELNDKSLEHASMIWQLRGDGDKSGWLLGNNWLAGESMVRYLAAPLFLGTVSPRRVWSASKGGSVFFQSPLQQLVEGREWQALLASRQMATDQSYQGHGQTIYNFWRYHGFLYRYAQTDMKQEEVTEKRKGILLVHGFGASGAQWNKLMKELTLNNSEDLFQGLAPDLIGFGQAEKPAISYTGYLWDSQVLEFVKEVAVGKHHWESYVVGGNSIGGFTSLQLSACDTAKVNGREVTSSGAPGSNRCNGLILMNSAGPLQTRDEVEASQNGVQGTEKQSVAQATALNRLPPCKPPSRPLARGIGNILLTYLRPRIQSICTNLYPTVPSAVDDELCGNILRDSLDPGAINVMMAGAKLPPPRTANELLHATFGSAYTSDTSVIESVFDGPVLIAQGVLDPLNDAKDRMSRFGALRQGITAHPLQAGHCPHDELPLEMSKAIISWLASTTDDRVAFINKG